MCETPECHNCNNTSEDSTLVKCADCREALVCADCARENDSRETICQNCAEDYYTCESCECVLHRDNINCADDKALCDTCYSDNYSQCDNCGDYHHNNTNQTDDSGACICESCWDNGHWAHCESCNRITDNYTFCDSCDECRCSDCACSCNNAIDLHDHTSDLKHNGGSAITDYHPEVEWRFLSDKHDLTSDPFFGVELEIETEDCTDKACFIVGDLLHGKCIASHDGSLDDGFEIVHTPHKYQAFRKNNYCKLLKELSKAGATSHDKGTCGLHVHIEKIPFLKKRLPFQALEILRKQEIHTATHNSDLFQIMFNKMKKHLLPFSQRNEDGMSYCRFNTGFERYSAVNLNNSATIEVRLWRGTLEPNRFRASIQMSLALLDFMQSVSMAVLLGKEDRLIQAFKTFLEKADRYQLLVKYLRSKRLFTFSGKTGKRPKLVLRNPTSTDSESITVF